MDAEAIAVLGVVALQALQLAQTAVLGRVVRQSLRPPPPPAPAPGAELELEHTRPGRRQSR
jgi:hypothetical protein